VLAALPWLMALDPNLVRLRLRDPASWGWFLLLVVGAGFGLAVFLSSNADPGTLTFWGRVYGAALHLQLIADFFVLVFAVLLRLWPQGAAVALAAFREGVRQPMFWVLAGAGFCLMWFSIFLPYFTFGEDAKMVRELCFDLAMLFSAAFGVIAASMSISEEIEGKTAITLMSKPVSRRQFLVGKFVGILLAALTMTSLLGCNLVAVVYVGPWYDQEPSARPAWVLSLVNSITGTGESAEFLNGVGFWLHDVAHALPGLVLGFGQVMVLLAVAVALATRLPMVATLPVCLLIFFLGHLTPVLSTVSQNRYPLIKFMSDLFSTLLPGLEFFDMGPAIVRDSPLALGDFALYTANVSLYAVLYSVIALLFGLILFEDRDLA